MRIMTKRGCFVIEFSAGRKIYVNRAVIGITIFGEIELFDGYGEGVEELTKEERAELADHMIARWTEFKGEGT